MREWPRNVIALLAVAVLLVAVAGAEAATCTLEAKRLGATVPGMPSDYIYRANSSQSFFMQVGGPPGLIVGPGGGAADFSKIVTKEPAKYEAEHPFRGVAKLGSQQFAFVLDSKPAEAAEAEGEEGEGQEGEAEEAEEAEAEEAQEAEQSEAAEEAEEGAEKTPPKLDQYNRLYFDLNHNGDLTDDGVIEAEQPSATRVLMSSGYSRFMFPRVDLTIEVDGTKTDYSFFFSVYSRASTSYSYASASLNAAVYREGEIMLDGKKRRVVLLDFNSNGRFDDEYAIQKGASYSDGGVVVQYGDNLLVDPDPSTSGPRSPYDATTSDDQYQMAKLVQIDGKYYDLEVSGAGDKLTLTPSSVSLGEVTGPGHPFRAVLYGDKGMLKISGDGKKPVAVPEGQWKLMSYTIDATGYEEKKEPSEAKEVEEEKAEGPSLLQSLVEALSPTAGMPSVSRPRYTLVSARATKDFEAFEVRKGKTVALPLGPPYKPDVKVQYTPSGGVAYLGMSLVGAGGERCSNMVIGGSPPGEPEFTISTADGKEVEAGKFKFG
jgi:hypothetical protein